MSPWMDLNDTDAHDSKMTVKDWVLLKSLVPFIKPEWRSLALSLVLLPLISVTQVVQPFLVKKAIDGPIAQGNLNGLLHIAFLFFILLACHYSLRYVQMVVAQVTGQRIVLNLRTALYNHLQSLSAQFFHRNPLGKIVTRISSDVENISDVFSTGGIAIFADFAVIIGIIVAMFVMNVQLATAAIIITPFILLTVDFFRRRSRQAYNALRVQLAQVNSTIQESLTGVDVIQLLQREDYNTQAFKKMSRQYMHTNVRSVLYDSAFTASVELLSYLTILLVMGWFVWHQAHHLHGTMTFGLLIAFLQYIQMLFEPIEEISDKFTTIQSGLASVEKIKDLMDIPPAIHHPTHPVPLARAQGHIEFKNVWFGYDPSRPVLKDFNLIIEPGQKIAITGPTGAGKSTIIRLLNRQYDPQQGQILLDGVDIRNYAVADLRRNIVVIPQDEFLFARSILDNITLDYKNPPDEIRLAEIIRTVHADTLIDRQPQGVQTMLPERGRNLSNGERQLLVFARALWHNPAIIVLDEATSAIDPQTERLVQDALEKSLEGRTAIIIAHRLATIENADKVFSL